MSSQHKKYILSTGKHYISNSGNDENKQCHGGMAGDQTGKEWCLKNWYNRPWTCVLRWADIDVGTLIAQLSIDAALNEKIGYDQYQRTTYWEQLKKVGYLPAKIAVPCEEDCTAGVSSNVRAAGYLLGIESLQKIPICSSRNMRSEFKKAGFIVLTDSKYLTSGNYLLPGDILLYDNHHAAVNVTKGKNVSYEFHDVLDSIDSYRSRPSESVEPEVDPLECKAVETTGRVNIRKAPGTDMPISTTAPKGVLLAYRGILQGVNGRNWYAVSYNGKNGWVSSKYAKLVK